MNRIPVRSISLTGLLMLAGPAAAPSHSIDWFAIDGGGGTSSGGSYTLSGTIGQADAGTSSGGSYTLAGGFWPGMVVPSSTGAPTLFIQLSGNNLVISWSPATPWFTLEQNDGFNLSNWALASSSRANPATLPISAATRFYRLRKPSLDG